MLKEEQRYAGAISKTAVGICFVIHLKELRWGGDVTLSFHWLRFVLDLLVAHKLAAVRSRVFAQVILMIVLRAVPGGGGLNGCRDRALPLP